MTLLSGAAVAMTVSYLVQPILTRMYTPDEFGLLDTFVALLALIVPFSSGKYEDAIVLPEEDTEAGHVLKLSLVILTGFTALLAAGLLFRSQIAELLGVAELSHWLVLIPVALLLVRLTMIGELWSVRTKKFKRISVANITRTTTMNVTKLAASGQGVAGLFGGYVVGFISAVALYSRSIVAALRLSSTEGAVTGMKRVARRYKDFPRFTMPASILGAMVNRLPFLLLLFFFSTEVVGLYGRAFAAIMVPLGVVGSAVSSVFYVFAAERRGTEQLAGSTMRVHDRLVLFALYPVAVIVLAGPEIFSVVFGSGWEVSGSYARVVGVWLFLSGVASPLTRLFDVLERQELELKVTAAIFVLQTSALVVGGLSGSPLTALLLLAIAGSVGRIVQLGVLHRIAGVSARDIAAPYLKYGLKALPGVVIVALTQISAMSAFWIVGGAVLGAGIYGLLSLGEIKSAFKSRTVDSDDATE